MGARARLERLGILFLSLAAAVFPLVVHDSYVLGVATQVLIYVGLALGLNMVVGYAGLLDLGYAAFFAIGAYGAALLSQSANLPLLAVVPLVMVMAALAGVIIGGPTLRLRSDYLAIVTLGFGEIVQITVTNLGFTGGATGIFDIPPLSLFGLTLAQPTSYYYAFLVLAALYTLVASLIRRSKIGRAWVAIREDEDAAQAMGVHTVAYKLYAYIAGALFASLVGAVYGAYMTAIAPTSFGYEQSILVLVAVLIGGMGSIPGMVVGGLLVVLIPEAMRGVSELRLLVFGVLMVAIMLLRPGGVWPERPLTWIRARGERGTSARESEAEGR